jgi:hypothetical protein
MNGCQLGPEKGRKFRPSHVKGVRRFSLFTDFFSKIAFKSSDFLPRLVHSHQTLITKKMPGY